MQLVGDRDEAAKLMQFHGVLFFLLPLRLLSFFSFSP
jgi:hypothetical protein